MKFAVSHCTFPKGCTNSFQLLGAEWSFDESRGNKWIEIHILGFVLYFEFLE